MMKTKPRDLFRDPFERLERSFPLAEAYQLDCRLADTEGGCAVRLRLSLYDEEVAVGHAQWLSMPTWVRVDATRGGGIVRLRFAPEGEASSHAAKRHHYWTLRFLEGQREGNVATVTVLERCAGATARPQRWAWKFPGNDIVSHRQLLADRENVRRSGVRLGAFSQHGQMLNLRDWVLWQSMDRCSGMVIIRPGTWSHPQLSLAKVAGTCDSDSADGISSSVPELNMASLADPLKRSYLLVTAPTALALDEVGPPKDGSDLGRRPYTSWPAVLIARRGFAREERLKRYHDQTLRNPLARPARFLLGGAEALQRAFHRIETQPALAGDDAFWLGRFDEAADAALAVLSRFRDAWCTAGYLHPLGNPVASRSLAPAAAQYHSLDHLGKLTDPQRREGAVLIADLAHLLARRDTYPWHLCHQPPEVPYERYGQSGSVYRGMLNQNFHTDFYAFVGLAGCVLPGHPRAKHWRRHAIRMFREQMEAFVWPDTEGYAYWEESHTYANHVKLTLLPLMLALRDLPGDEAIDLLNDPHDTAAKKFRSMCRGMLAMLSPPDRLHEGRREVAAIGDHGYWHKGGYGSLFGYLASVFDADRDAFLWAWRQCGSALNGEVHAFVGPLLTPEPNDKPIQASPPTLPALLRLEGLGAIARRGLGTAKESLLVVRCGDAWGHHHPDEGSFWWWHQGHLVACDAGFGTGEHKLRHTGHSVLGWRDFAPIQHLDRHGFRIVDDVMLESLGETRITCDIPVLGEQISSVLDRPLPNNKQGLLRRVFTWSADGALSIMDEMRGGPSDRIEWRLWCPSERFVRMDDRTFHVQLKTGLTLALRCDEVPTDFETHGTAGTAGLFLRYESPNLTHHVTPIENR